MKAIKGGKGQMNKGGVRTLYDLTRSKSVKFNN